MEEAAEWLAEVQRSLGQLRGNDPQQSPLATCLGTEVECRGDCSIDHSAGGAVKATPRSQQKGFASFYGIPRATLSTPEQQQSQLGKLSQCGSGGLSGELLARLEALEVQSATLCGREAAMSLLTARLEGLEASHGDLFKQSRPMDVPDFSNRLQVVERNITEIFNALSSIGDELSLLAKCTTSSRDQHGVTRAQVGQFWRAKGERSGTPGSASRPGSISSPGLSPVALQAHHNLAIATPSGTDTSLRIFTPDSMTSAFTRRASPTSSDHFEMRPETRLGPASSRLPPEDIGQECSSPAVVPTVRQPFDGNVLQSVASKSVSHIRTIASPPASPQDQLLLQQLRHPLPQLIQSRTNSRASAPQLQQVSGWQQQQQDQPQPQLQLQQLQPQPQHTQPQKKLPQQQLPRQPATARLAKHLGAGEEAQQEFALDARPRSGLFGAGEQLSRSLRSSLEAKGSVMGRSLSRDARQLPNYTLSSSKIVDDPVNVVASKLPRSASELRSGNPGPCSVRGSLRKAMRSPAPSARSPPATPLSAVLSYSGLQPSTATTTVAAIEEATLRTKSDPALAGAPCSTQLPQQQASPSVISPGTSPGQFVFQQAMLNGECTA